MSLQIYNEDDDKEKSEQLIHQAGTTSRNYVDEADMGGYYVSRLFSPPKPPTLITTGAASCTIILTHFTNGTGALGHYAGTAEAALILEGIEQMIASTRVDDTALAAILFSAGSLEDNERTLPFQNKVFRGN